MECKLVCPYEKDTCLSPNSRSLTRTSTRFLPGADVDVVVPTVVTGPEDDGLDADADAGAGTRVVPGLNVVALVALVVVTGDVVVDDLDSTRIPLFGSCIEIKGWSELV